MEIEKQIKDLIYERDLEILNIKLKYNKKIKDVCNSKEAFSTEIKIGDIIGNVLGMIKVDKIEGTYSEYWGFQIKFLGLRYKKIKGEYLRTKDNKISTFINHPSLIIYKNAEQ